MQQGTIPTGKLRPTEAGNVRGDLGDLKWLAGSLATEGVLQPLVIRWVGKVPEVICGHRRLAAAKIVGLKELPCRVVDAPTPEAVRVYQLAENLHRKDLSPIEEAEAFEAMLAAGGSPADVAEAVGCSEAHVHRRRHLLNLTTAGRAALAEGRLGLRAAMMLARVLDPDDQDRALEEALHHAEADEVRWATERHLLSLKDAPFSRSRKYGEAPPCGQCPQRTGAQGHLFEGAEERADLCLARACYEQKTAAEWERQRALAEKKGRRVLTEAEAKKVFPSEWSTRPDGRSSWVGADERCYQDAEGRTWRQLLKASGVEAEEALAQRPDGAAALLVDRKAALAAAGLDVSRASSKEDREAVAAEIERQNAIALEAFHSVAEELQHRARESGLELEAWRALVRDVVAMVVDDHLPRDSGLDTAAILAELEEASLYEIQAQLLRVVLMVGADAARWRGERPELAEVLAAIAGIDYAAQERMAAKRHPKKRKAKGGKGKAKAKAKA